MPAADRFEITVKGKGGHGAYPHNTKDSILIASQFMDNLQQIVSCRVDSLDSAVVSVCSFDAAGPYNAIANSSKLTGTARALKEETRDLMDQEIRRIVEGTCHLSDADFENEYKKGYPVLLNHKEETEFVMELAATVPAVSEVREIEPVMGGVDYSYYLHHVKRTYFFTGAQPKDVLNSYPHHHPKFDIDEEALLIAAKILAKSTVEYMENN